MKLGLLDSTFDMSRKILQFWHFLLPTQLFFGYRQTSSIADFQLWKHDKWKM